MIDARKAAGITNTSSYSFLVSSMMDHAVVKSMGRKDLIAVIGNTDRYTPSAQQFTKIISGYHYAYYLSNNAEIAFANRARSEEHTSELQSRQYLVCRLLLEKNKYTKQYC